MEAKTASWVIRMILKAKECLVEAGYQEKDINQMDSFSIQKIYKLLRGHYPKVAWRRLVCNNRGSPRWTFILRLALCDRLQARTRLAKWGIIDDAKCPLCDGAPETVAHLFFECARIWQRLLRWQGIPRQPMERNAKVFQQQLRTEDAIVRMIIQEVHFRGSVTCRHSSYLTSLNFYT
ncbi:uncharacterized protein LOC132066468 [Lycium ferocissimum]|uniref:uncharacterized protein LOC132066468 n=1 Tax=Lycium ferocissimum TaxID=112874 RepID=UPI0028157BDF|nr:uncharacterized protein LOC132066468 [Lycium ferocissimum]